MIALTDITDSHLDFVRELYESSFPPDERRDWWQFMHILRHEPRFRCSLIADGEVPCGFLCHWLMDGYVYVEHFAVSPSRRGIGAGGTAIDAIKKRYGLTLILEAENPDKCDDKDTAQRRLAFYGRHGFRVFDKDYLQPIYRAKDKQVPLYLLTTGENLTQEQVEQFRSIVYAPVDTLLHYEPTVASTNSALTLRNAAEPLPDKYALYTFCQPEGRGQRGNTWEAQPGKNILISWLLRPQIRVDEQFRLSQALCLIFAEWLQEMLPDGTVSVKWPNDIYCDDLKVAGVLIENVVIGDAIDHSVVGAGFNINQLEFTSDAPNPVSVIQVSRQYHDLHTLAIDLNERVTRYAELMSDPLLHDKYMARLYRRDGMHRYRLPDGEGFKARIADVKPNGVLVLQDENNDIKEFAFKEIIFTH